MIRWVLALTLSLGGAVLADPPKFSQGGFLFSVMYGPGFWKFDRTLLASQVGDANADLFITDAVTGHTVSLRAGYNIFGHASLGVDFTATGWDITNANRGGAGFITGYVAWHPLELVWLKKQTRPIGLDASTLFGVGYGICGEQRGMDGLVLQWGANVDYFFARYFGAGVFVKGTFMQWDKFYIDYNNRDLPGATIPTPRGAGGSFWTMGIALTFRAGE
ncbi:MAG: hypothetical protein JNJ54_08515 [Myxococcaceae bacterium]|nr:hypothetical protein [Myxococcaceae bacterium]